MQSETTNALALLAQAESLAVNAASTAVAAPAADARKLTYTPEQVKSLQTHLQSLVARFHGLADIQDRIETEAAQAAQARTAAPPLIERLEAFPPGGPDVNNIVEYPPKLSAVPVKPLYLDLAWNYIHYPGEVDEDAVASDEPPPAKEPVSVETPAQQEQKPAKRGWFGFGRS